MDQSPSITSSARKHGIKDAAIRHAFDHPVFVVELDEGLTMLIGPDPAGNLIEVGVVGSATGTAIVHAMPARSKFLR